jgi:hypothetical protein
VYAVIKNVGRGHGNAPERSVLIENGQPVRYGSFIEAKVKATMLNSELMAKPPQQQQVWYSPECEVQS